MRATSKRTSAARSPIAAVTPAAAGRITRGIPSARASRQPCTGPEPPKATSVRSRGSRPRSIETTRVASSMFVFTIAWTPHAASASGSPRGRATFASSARAAPAASRRIEPPAKSSGFR